MTSLPVFLILYSLIFAAFAVKGRPNHPSLARKTDDWGIAGLIFVVSYLSALFFDTTWPIFAGFLAILGFP